MAKDTVNPNKEPSAYAWTVITSFVADIDLTTHAEGNGQAAREIVVVSGGVLVVEKPNGSSETTPTLLANYGLVGQVSKIKAAGSGTTATAVIVYW